MGIDDERNEEIIQESLSQFKEQLTDEALFWDEFLISIINNLLNDKAFDFEPGEKPDKIIIKKY